ncbi:hypothetical protein CRYUN_Cryun05aG0016600 [Craigia yunnanensis]
MDSPPLSKCGLGLITNETPRVNPNVIESSLVFNLKPMTPTPPPSPLPSEKKDPGGIGFIDDMGGGVDGLMSCTESLGFESCDERRVDDDDDDENNDHRHMEFCEGERGRWRRKRSEEKRERNKKFPPPLSSLNKNGQPCFYLKPVRKNGSLELTEVRIQRPEILRAVRQNCRLRFYLVSSDVFSKINEEEDDENEETKQEEQEQLEFHFQGGEEEKKVEELWKYRVSEEGWKCHELVMSHHHHHHHHINDHHSLHVWRQPCVTTRTDVLHGVSKFSVLIVFPLEKRSMFQHWETLVGFDWSENVLSSIRLHKL